MSDTPFPDDTAETCCTARRLAGAGLRPTRQRLDLGSLLFRRGNRHVTAEQLHAEAVAADIKVSLATVYNTLNQFRDAGLLREVVVEAGATWFDTNIDNHHHFFHENTRHLQDICCTQMDLPDLPCLPAGTRVARVDVIIRLRDAD
ncbi:iron response transcriptional regulator IrrA [Niveispirillum sp.]|uniref:iron response transcriptional regulator IrrA n=1 Tax=Niveispirillum sp. TaxID=1917217 RepID=UPI001B73FEAA|nr:Fur family transcriptional regulator [Niveispirillum sp.]MBP7336341.1 transcriptional repressor [Niveispirillum sp.]